MKAIVKTQTGSGFVELLERPEPAAGPGMVKIRVASAGICGTDIKIRSGDNWCNPPVILCHEYSGMVAEVGEGVATVKPGDRVISETAQVVCGNCYYCKTGNYLMCSERLSIGYGVDGAFASHIVVREGIVHRIPEGVSMDAAALCEPLAVALHAVYDTMALKPTDTVVVMGPGTIGQLVAQAAGGFGCRVVVTGVTADGERLALAKKMGAAHTVDTMKQDVVEVVKSLTGGEGADVVFDCSGAAPAIRSGLEMLRRKGTMVQVGLTKPDVEIPYALLPQKELSIRGTFGHTWTNWEHALRLMSEGKVQVESLITASFPLERWEEAFAMAEVGEGIKILIHPNA